MIQFYAPDILTDPSLGPQEALHCVRVLRNKAGDMIRVTDGNGSVFMCRILQADSRKASLEIVSRDKVSKSWNFNITIAVAPTKNADRMSWLVEKATEIGVDRICFFPSRFCERKAINVDRLKRVAISAMNQSLKANIPVIENLDSFSNLRDLGGYKYFGYCDSSLPRLSFTKELIPAKDVSLAIGPEGDFSPEEVQSLLESGFKAVTFGDERLRTETAALYGLSAIHILSEYFKP